MLMSNFAFFVPRVAPRIDKGLKIKLLMDNNLFMSISRQIATFAKLHATFTPSLL